MNFQGFIDSLSFMGLGMASIIIVIGVLILAVLLLNLFSSDKMKTSRKVILVVAFAVLLISLSLLNGMNMDRAVKEYVENNKEKIVSIFENNVGVTGLESEIQVQGRGFIITFKDDTAQEISESEKTQIQEMFNTYQSYFEDMLLDMKKDIKELEKYEFRVTDAKGNIYLTIVADGK